MEYTGSSLINHGFGPRAPSLTKTIKIYFHVYNETNGTGGIDINRRQSIVDRLNTTFSENNTGFSFVWNDCETEIVNNSNFSSGLDGNPSCIYFNRNVDQPDAIDIHVLGDDVSNRRVPGKADGIPSSQFYVGGRDNNNEPVSSTATIEHEMGHCLGLFHTHAGICETSDGTRFGICRRNIIPVLNASSGDFVPDTPDDGIAEYDEVNCVINGPNDDCGEEDLDPTDNPVNNIMSYYRECRTEFTPGQAIRMHQEVLTDVIVSPDLIIVGDTYRLPITIEQNTNSSATVMWLDSWLHDSYDLTVKRCSPNGFQTVQQHTNLDESLSNGFVISGLTQGNTYEVSINPAGQSCDLYYSIEFIAGGVAIFCNPCRADQADLIFNQDDVLSVSEFKGKIRVIAGATLTISSDVTFGEGSSIYIGAGSRLVVDGANLSACPDQEWTGIEVFSGIGLQPAGEVILKGATIADADIGVNATTSTSWQLWPGGPTYNITVGGGRVFASDGTTFRDCRTGLHFGPYGSTILGIQQVSTLTDCTFDECNVGIKFDGNAGVQLDGCDFLGSSSLGRADIEASASGFVAQDCEFTSMVDVQTPAMSVYAPEIRNCDFIDAQLHLEHGMSLSTTIIDGNQFFCTDPSDGIYMLSENNATITGNDFYGCDEGLYYENTGASLSGNDIIGNFFDYNYCATTAVQENDFEYLQNCFVGSARRDIDLVDALLFPEHGTEEESAGNCFSDFSQANTGKAIRGTVMEEFTYHSKDAAAGVDNCKNPKAATSGEYVIADAVSETDPVCGTNDYPYTILNRYLYCNYQRGNFEDVIEMIAAIEEQIIVITNDDSLSLRVKRWLIARLKRCIDLWTRRSAKYFIEDGFTDEAIALLKSRPEFRYKALAYGTILSTLDYDAAETYLLSVPTTTTAETDYVMAQQIYLDYLRDTDGYDLSTDDESTLLAAGQRSNTLSYASRAVYRLLTGDRITLSRKHSEETQERSKESTSFIENSFVIFPNPVSDDILTIESDSTGPYKAQVMSIQGVLLSETKCNNNCKIDLFDTSPGVYIVKVIQNDGPAQVQKIIRL